MMPLQWPELVLQRRINAPMATVERLLCDHREIDAGAALALDNNGTALRFDSRFDLVFPPFGVECTSWRAFASVRSPRGRRVDALEIELNIWDRTSTEIVVRPESSRASHWTGRRLRRYFRSAHAAADLLTMHCERRVRVAKHERAARSRYAAMMARFDQSSRATTPSCSSTENSSQY